MIKRLFWNDTQQRLRTFWRLAIQTLAYVSLIFALGILIGLVAALYGMATGQVSPSDPESFQQMSGMLLESPIFRLLFTGGDFVITLLTVWLAGKFLDRRPFTNFGFHLNGRWWADLGFGLALGALLMAAVFLVELALGWVEIADTFQAGAAYPFILAVGASLIVFIFVGIKEEVLSRGYHLLNMAEGLNFPGLSPQVAILLAYVLSSAIFGLLHATNPNATVISTINLVIAGLFLGLGYVLTGELGIPIGLHITWNFFQGNVFGFPVSGTSSGGSIIAIDQRGPEVWTGGAFGPEAGLIGLAAIAVGSLLTFVWVRWLRGKIALQPSLATYTPPAQSTATDEPGGETEAD